MRKDGGADRDRLRLVVRSIKVLHYLSSPGWKTYSGLADFLGVTVKTARRWVQSVEQAGLCIESRSADGISGWGDNRFRLVLTERRIVDAASNVRVAARTF